MIKDQFKRCYRIAREIKTRHDSDMNGKLKPDSKSGNIKTALICLIERDKHHYPLNGLNLRFIRKFGRKPNIKKR